MAAGGWAASISKRFNDNWLLLSQNWETELHCFPLPKKKTCERVLLDITPCNSGQKTWNFSSLPWWCSCTSSVSTWLLQLEASRSLSSGEICKNSSYKCSKYPLALHELHVLWTAKGQGRPHNEMVWKQCEVREGGTEGGKRWEQEGLKTKAGAEYGEKGCKPGGDKAEGGEVEMGTEKVFL